jgi:hypothetical protein
MTEIEINPIAAPIGWNHMNLMAIQNDDSGVEAFAFVPPACPMATILDRGSDIMRAGIRHIASGRKTVINAGPKTAMAMVVERAASRCGLLEDPRLEAVLVDEDGRVFAAFWP